MAACFKRRIVNKIVSLVRTNYVSDVELHDLEQRLYRLAKVQPLQRNSAAIQPSLRMNAGQLRNVVQTDKTNGNQLQDWLQTVHTDRGHYHFPMDTTKFIQAVLSAVHSDRDQYGYTDTRSTKLRVCVEFSSPNVAKPLHVGHLRSTIIGNVIANLYEAAGHDVTRLNFLGDWGTQFGLLTLGLRRYCDEDKLAHDPMLEMLKAYVEINKDVEKESSSSSSVTSSSSYQEGMDLFSRLEKGDPELTAVWSQLRTLTLTELDKIYKRLGVKFTHVQYESDFHQKTDAILSRLGQDNLLEFGEDGVGYVPLNNDELGRAPVIKSDGSSLYLTRDLAAAIDRHNTYSPDRMHYVVEMGQRGHFTKLLSILQQLEVSWALRPVEEVHVRFGRVQGMSTRRGQVVHLKEVLDEARTRVMAAMQDRETTRVEGDMETISDRLAVSSIILQDLKSHRSKDYTFSWDKVLNFKADSGVFVQYCHARICSMLARCQVEVPSSMDVVDMEAVTGDIPMARLVLHMSRYPDVFDEGLEKLAPHHLVQYLFQLCHLVNAAYAVCPVKGESPDVAKARLLVFDCSRQVIANCLMVLGISPLARM